MTDSSATTANATSPRRSTLDRPTLMRLAGTEYERGADLLRSLRPDDWRTPTECPGWEVRQVACHMLGMAAMAASIREMVRQQRAAAKRGGEPIDALTAMQVEERAAMSPDEVVSRFARVGPRAARARRRTPSFIRRRTMPETALVGDTREEWTFGYLVDTILTRDPWMHRVDITRATARPMHLTAEHDGALVADVVDEWSARHGRPFDLTLTGPAGGHWSRGLDGEALRLDALDFCRVLSGRGSATGLLTTPVPF